MQKIIICILAMFSLVIGQISMSDINRLNDQQIEAIKSELGSNPELIPESTVLNEVNLSSVNVSAPKSKEGPYYFGYDYFEREINFFDNIICLCSNFIFIDIRIL